MASCFNMRRSIRSFSIPPGQPQGNPRATGFVQIPTPRGKTCVHMPYPSAGLMVNCFVKGKFSGRYIRYFLLIDQA